MYFLSAADRAVLMELVADFRRRHPNTKNRTPPGDVDLGYAPEVYLAWTPRGGIPALGPATTGTAYDDAPGHSECVLYRLDPDTGRPVPVIRDPLTIYNFSTTAVPGHTWVVATREKFGAWVATALAGAAAGHDPGDVPEPTVMVPVVSRVCKTYLSGTGGTLTDVKVMRRYLTLKASEAAGAEFCDDSLTGCCPQDYPGTGPPTTRCGNHAIDTTMCLVFSRYGSDDPGPVCTAVLGVQYPLTWSSADAGWVGYLTFPSGYVLKALLRVVAAGAPGAGVCLWSLFVSCFSVPGSDCSVFGDAANAMSIVSDHWSTARTDPTVLLIGNAYSTSPVMCFSYGRMTVTVAEGTCMTPPHGTGTGSGGGPGVGSCCNLNGQAAVLRVPSGDYAGIYHGTWGNTGYPTSVQFTDGPAGVGLFASCSVTGAGGILYEVSTTHGTDVLTASCGPPYSLTGPASNSLFCDDPVTITPT